MRLSDFQTGRDPILSVFARVAREIGQERLFRPERVGFTSYSSARGPESVTVWLGRLLPNDLLPKGASWFPVKRLAENLLFIQHQSVPIEMATNYLQWERHQTVMPR